MDANLPPAIKEQYLTDGHACQHATGVWNAFSEDQFGEQTYSWCGKSKGGLVGISLSADQVAGWVLSHHVCNTLALAMDEMFADREYNERADKHKEETEGRKTLDYEDRKKTREPLEKGCTPLNTESDYPVNVWNGRVSHCCVNVQNSLQIGTRMAAQFREGQPDNFYKPLSKQVTTMESLKKSITVGDRQVCDIDKIDSRMLVISKGHAAPNHKLTLTTVLPARDIIMKNTFNKQQLAHLLFMCQVPPSVHILGDDDNIFDHEEADVSMFSYANKFAKEGKREIQILADDTGVFVLLMHRPNSHELCMHWQVVTVYHIHLAKAKSMRSR